MPPSLQIPRLFADAFYLLAHDQVSGRPRQAPRLTHLSMGAAALAELIVHEIAYIDYHGVGLYSGQRAWDVVQMTMSEEIAAERKRRPAQDWMRHLGPIVTPLIAARLERAGYHRAIPPARIRLFGPYFITAAPRWEPDNSAYYSVVSAQLNRKLDSGEDVGWQEQALIALAYAVGLNRQVFPYIREEQAQPVLYQASFLGGGLPQLFEDTRLAVSSVVAAATH